MKLKDILKESDKLPMDNDSRMARAKAMGFDTDTVWYHGTAGNFPSFNKTGKTVAGWFTDDPTMANEYARDGGISNYPNGGENVIPVYFRKSDRVGRFADIVDSAKSRGIDRWSDEFDDFVNKTYDFIDHSSGGVRVMIPVNPEDIRSIYAKFDPSKSNSPHLSEGLYINE